MVKEGRQNMLDRAQTRQKEGDFNASNTILWFIIPAANQTEKVTLFILFLFSPTGDM